MRLRLGIILSAVAAMLCAGCAMVSNPPRGSAGDGPEITIPVFNSEGYRGVIALPPATHSGTNIMILVRGQVVSPAQLKVREGISVLEAIQAAGGFTPYAATWEAKAIDADGKHTDLRLHRHKRFRRLPLVWYAAQKKDRDIFVVKDRMTIHVPLGL